MRPLRYAKFTGRLGVCLATSGPGGLHLTNGLYDAKLDGAPVLAITGHHYSDLIDTTQQQDVDLTRVFEDLAVYNTRVMNSAHVGNVAPLACRTALARRGVAHICFPTDLQELDADAGPRLTRDATRATTSDVYAPTPGSCRGRSPPRGRTPQCGSKIAILAGQGALGAGDELERVAERSARRSSRRCSARASCPTTARTRPAASASWDEAVGGRAGKAATRS